MQNLSSSNLDPERLRLGNRVVNLMDDLSVYLARLSNDELLDLARHIESVVKPQIKKDLENDKI